MTLSWYVSLLNSIGLGIVAIAFMYKSIKQNNSQYDSETIRKFEDAIKARDLQIESLQTEIHTLQDKVKSLEQANLVFQNMVTGKDILADIQKALGKFDILLGDDGVINKFIKTDAAIISELNSIKKLVTKR